MLVHDLGENWELVSDAFNSIVQLKVIICLIVSFSYNNERCFFLVHEKVSFETNLVIYVCSCCLLASYSSQEDVYAFSV